MKQIATFLLLCLYVALLFPIQVIASSCVQAIELNCGQTKDLSTVHRDSSLWFKLIGTGDIVYVSLCNGSPSVQVFEGTCGDLLEIKESSGLAEHYRYICGFSSEEVSFKTEIGTAYYLRYQASSPQDDSHIYISCTAPDINNVCQTAIAISISDTISYTLYNSYPSILDACGDYYLKNRPDVYFKFEGTGSYIFLEGIERDPPAVKFYKGDCNDFECIPILDIYALKKGIATELGQTYFMRVWPSSRDNLQLRLSSFIKPEHDDCSSAKTIPFGDTLSINLNFTTISSYVCTNPYYNQFNSWYQFTGDGNIAEFELLEENSFGSLFDLSITKGGCEDGACQFLTKTEHKRLFQTELGADYLVQVHSGSWRPSNSDLTQRITFNKINKAINDEIDQAIELVCNDTLAGTTRHALADENLFSRYNNRPIVWYKVKGKDEFVTINTVAIPEAFYSPITNYYLINDSSYTYAGSASSPKYLEKDSTLYIAVEGANLYLDFKISSTCTPKIENSSCSEAKPITLADTIQAKINYALQSKGDGCNESTKPGLWYTYEGKGELVDFVFEKYSNSHEFSISKGNCDSLICVDYFRDYPESDIKRTRIYMELGTTYFIHVFEGWWNRDNHPFKFYFEPFIIAENDICSTASFLSCGAMIRDSVEFATVDTSSCVTLPNYYNGLWYTIQGEGQYVTINPANYAMEFYLFEGECSKLSCQNEKLLSYRSKMMFFAEQGKQYYLLAYTNNLSYNDNLKDKIVFDFNCFDKETNDALEDAIPVACGDTYRGFALQSSYSVMEECYTSEREDLWLTIEGNDEFVSVTHNSRYDNRTGDRLQDIEVYTLDSENNFVCFNNFDGRAYLSKNTTYYFRLVLDELVSIYPFYHYDFDLTISCTERIPNYVCDNAIPLNCQDTLTINTLNSVKDPGGNIYQNRQGCGGVVPGMYPAWFSLEGDDSWKTFSVINGDGSQSYSQIWVSEGDCDSLNCLYVGRNFYAENGKDYYINLNRYPGEKIVLLTCGQTAKNDFCEEAIALSYGDTIRANFDYSTNCVPEENYCHNESVKKSIWYSLIGSGSITNLNLGINANHVHIRIYEDHCCNREEIAPIYGTQHNKYFKSMAGRKYFISVEAIFPNSDGKFELLASNVSEENISICDSSLPLENKKPQTVDLSKATPYYSIDNFSHDGSWSWLRFEGSGGIDTLTILAESFDGFTMSFFLELGGSCKLIPSPYSSMTVLKRQADSTVFTINTLESQRYIVLIKDWRKNSREGQATVILHQTSEKSPCQLTIPPIIHVQDKNWISIDLEPIGLSDDYFIRLQDDRYHYITDSSKNGILDYIPSSTGYKIIEYQSEACNGIEILPVVLEEDSDCQETCETNPCCCLDQHFNETSEGDISDDPEKPTIIQLYKNLDTVTNCQQTNPTDRDYFTIHIPENFVLNSLQLVSYESKDQNSESFIGIQAGTFFTTPTNNSELSQLLGGMQYSFANTGTNILPAMGQLEGSQGFNSFLPAGSYTLSLEQTTGTSCTTFKFGLSEAEACAENITFSDEMILAGTHKASKDVITSGSVTIDNKGSVSLKAGNSITLTAGFFASSGTTFTAQIQTCESSLQKERKQLQSSNIFQTPAVVEFSVRPNPFSKFAIIDYTLQETSTISLAIYNMSGQLLKALINSERQELGNYSYKLIVEELNAGMYILVLSTEKERLNKKIILLK